VGRLLLLRRDCPRWFQERLSQAGGFNKHGEPNFKLVWGESESMRDGGYFVRDGFLGYRDVPVLGKDACWALMMWEPAEKHGTAYRWYKDHTDEVTDLVTLGQYPYKGRYRLIKKFIHRERIAGEWVATRMEPTHFILDIMLPMLKEWLKLSNEQKMKVAREEIEADEKEADRLMADSMHDKKIRRDSPLVQKRAELMERTMAQAMMLAARTQKGLQQVGA
jgi:hypothetical protein